MKYSPKFFHDTMPEWKRKKDPFIAKIIHRPISFLFSSIFAEWGLTPNQVSFISLIIAFITCLLFFSTKVSILILAAILMNIWSITDSADGNMARSIGGKPYGDFIDATSSYYMVGFMFVPKVKDENPIFNPFFSIILVFLVFPCFSVPRVTISVLFLK